MFDPKNLDEMAKKFTDNLPPALKDMKQEMEKNVRSMLQTGFSKLDLVTREEFDVQAEVLSRTRAKLDELEKKLAEYEELKNKK